MPNGNTGGTSVTPGPSPNSGSATPSLETPNVGGTSISVDAPSAAVSSAIEQEVTVNLLGGLISPATVEEARPGGGGGVQAFLLRKLARHESRIARLESVQ